MKGVRKIGLFLFLIFLVIQFIQPMPNISTGLEQNDISHAYAVPDAIHRTLTEKCYDCHSNHTRYAWYFRIQPLGWWLAAHVYEGKSQLNFSEFRAYRDEEARDKLSKIATIMSSGSDHLKNYSLFGPADEVSVEDMQVVQSWVSTLVTNP
jgi:hypothetical protein